MADSKRASEDKGQIGEVIDLVKTYAKQETIGPLKSLGHKMLFGALGALALATGLFFLALGLLRLIQTEIPRLGRGTMSILAYVIVLLFCAIVTVIALSRIKKIEKDLN